MYSFIYFFFLGGGKFFQILMVSDKAIHKAFWIHKTIYSFICLLYSFHIQGFFSKNTAFQESPVNMNIDKQMQGHKIHVENCLKYKQNL